MNIAIEQAVGRIAAELHRRAKTWTYNGHATDAAVRRITHRHGLQVEWLAARVIFTRDAGMHTSGWIRNPDYERCYHLSIAPMQPARDAGAKPLVDNWHDVEDLLVRAFFGDNARLTWRESAKSPDGIAREVAHWRLFCDPGWAPLMPRGEVYSKLNTPPDWESWSERHARGAGPIIESTLDPT